MKPLYWKFLLIVGAMIVGASLVVPKALRKNARVGLDETPHTELILEVDEEYLLQRMLAREAAKLQDSFEQAGIKGSVRQKNGVIVAGFRSNKHFEQGTQLLNNLPISFDDTSAKTLEVTEIKNRLFKIQFTPAYLDHIKQTDIDETIVEIVHRIKLSNADISRIEKDKALFRYVESGDKQLAILVGQIREPAYLSFHEVMEVANRTDFLRCAEDSRCPRGTSAYPQKNGYGYMLVKDEAIVSGADLKGTSEGIHPYNNFPILNFAFKAKGSSKFCDFTSKHEGELFAVVLNKEIITAPRINGAICGGRGFIEGGFTMESAENLALRLNAGTLPTKLRVVEERGVTPPQPTNQ